MIDRHFSRLVAAFAIVGATAGCGGASGAGGHLGEDCPSDHVVPLSRVESASTDVIAFVSDRDGNGELYTMGLDGSRLTRLTHSTTHEALPAWSPDGTRIAFVSLKEPGLESESSIMMMNADGTKLTEVATTEKASPFTWSPDGSQIAYASSDDDIHVIDLADRRDQNLTNSSGFDGWPAWSPDGTRIVFTSNRAGTDQLWMMQADGTEPILLTTQQAEEASWSPKGDKIVFASTRDGEPGSSDPRMWNESFT